MSGGNRPLEKTIQRSVLAYLAARGITAVHVPNGSVLAGGPRERAMQMNALKRNGLRPGFPDLLLLKAGRVGFFEVKREGEKLSSDQEHWRDALKAIGFDWQVVRSIEDAEETLLEWGWHR